MTIVDFIKNWNFTYKNGGSITEFALAGGMTRSQAIKRFNEINDKLGRRKDGSTYLLPIKETAAHHIADRARMREIEHDKFIASLQQPFKSKIRTPLSTDCRVVNEV